jgi:hypothetical protein
LTQHPKLLEHGLFGNKGLAAISEEEEKFIWNLKAQGDT